MAPFGVRAHVFVIRAWLEPREVPGRLAEWRFRVECVGSDERRYFRSLNEVTRFLRHHLPGPRGWRRWLRRLASGAARRWSRA